MGEIAVVREEDQALGGQVETPDREDPGLGRDEPGDGRAPAGVATPPTSTPAGLLSR